MSDDISSVLTLFVMFVIRFQPRCCKEYNKVFSKQCISQCYVLQVHAQVGKHSYTIVTRIKRREKLGQALLWTEAGNG